MTQTASAFGYVQKFAVPVRRPVADLADWGATVERLTTFSDTIQRAKRQAAADARELEIETVPQADLVLDDVAVLLPNGRALLEDVDLDIRPGQRIVLQGPSGSGKTTLFRVLAGIWPFARGRIRVPADARVLFLPQKPYIPVGSLREALTYPDPVEAHGDAEILEALASASSTTWPTGSTRPRSGRSPFRAASSSGSPSPAPSWSGRTGCSWTRPPPPSTRRRRRPSTSCWPSASPTRRSSASPTSRAWRASTRRGCGSTRCGAASCRSRSRRRPSPP